MRRNKKNLILSLLLLLLLCIGLGYAYLTSNLSITGATEIAANTWDIHFDNLVVSEGSVTATNPAIISPLNNTSITYSVLLSRPKQFYEFTVDIVNAGTLPGKVSLAGISGITPAAEDIVDYSIKYTSNDNDVVVDDIINGGTTKKIKVRVFYKDDINPEDLPNENIILQLVFTLNFVQSPVKERPSLSPQLLQLISDNSDCMVKYDGLVTDQPNDTVTASNVYFNKCANKRNILFGGYCWQMIRTTESAGIKMIYNGEPVDGKCESTRGNHKGVVQNNYGIDTLNSEYLYGSSFTYDTTNNTFTLVDTTTSTWNDLTYKNLIGKYTCKSLSNTCSTLYNINNRVSSSEAYYSSYVIGDTNYAQIGTSAFNADVDSFNMIGYMFDNNYKFVSKEIIRKAEVLKTNNNNITEYTWVADSIAYDSSRYRYTLVNPYRLTSEEIKTMSGKYTIFSTDQSATSTYAAYVSGMLDDSYRKKWYGVILSGGHMLDYYNYPITFGESFIDNGNNTYTIINPTRITKADWFSYYNTINGKYICENENNNICDNILFVNYTDYQSFKSMYEYDIVKFSNSFSFNTNTNEYTLDDSSIIVYDGTNYSSLNNAHYTCFNKTGICDSIKYVYYHYSYSDGNIYYIILEDGESVNDALEKIIFNKDKNVYNSSIKAFIDSWYAENLLLFNDKIEDVVYCDNRKVTDYAGWNPNGGDVWKHVDFDNLGYFYSSNLSCENIEDQFSSKNSKARLIYPIGLLRGEERNYFDNNSLVSTGNAYWSINAVNYYGTTSILFVSSNGDKGGAYGMANYGVRPVISLANGTMFSSGVGSETDPWIVQ